jgi:phenylpropionate dioxygenase-like ring-hydroxylating dioxygenase large terminal subunit
MLERVSWWPVALAADLGDRPMGSVLLDQPLVLWRDPAGQAVAQVDRCPHRGAKLSMGCVKDGALQCPYHGWRFDAAGACTHIPAAPGVPPPARNAVQGFEVQEAHGLVWVALETPTAPPPQLQGLPTRHLVYGPFDVATSAPRAVENFLDTSHFAFVHEGWLGDAAHPEVPPYEVTHTSDGRPVIESYKAWQPRASAAAEEGDWVHYRYEVLSPYAALLSKQGDAGGPADSYTIWACPTSAESCRLWFAQYTTDTTSSDSVLRDFQVAIFAQDQPILESQSPKRLPLEGGELMSVADRLSVAYRRYLKGLGITHGVC